MNSEHYRFAENAIEQPTITASEGQRMIANANLAVADALADAAGRIVEAIEILTETVPVDSAHESAEALTSIAKELDFIERRLP